MFKLQSLQSQMEKPIEKCEELIKFEIHVDATIGTQTIEIYDRN